MLVNLTPHEVNVLGADGAPILTLPRPPRLEDVARISTSTVEIGTEQGIPLFRQTFGEPVGLPEPVTGIYLVVSALVRVALPGRKDLLSPGELVRDADGQPKGCRGLVSN